MYIQQTKLVVVTGNRRAAHNRTSRQKKKAKQGNFCNFHMMKRAAILFAFSLLLLRSVEFNGAAEARKLLGGKLQSKATRVGYGAASRATGSLSMPKGSPWCGGRPTIWYVLH